MHYKFLLILYQLTPKQLTLKRACSTCLRGFTVITLHHSPVRISRPLKEVVLCIWQCIYCTCCWPTSDCTTCTAFLFVLRLGLSCCTLLPVFVSYLMCMSEVCFLLVIRLLVDNLCTSLWTLDSNKHRSLVALHELDAIDLWSKFIILLFLMNTKPGWQSF